MHRLAATLMMLAICEVGADQIPTVVVTQGGHAEIVETHRKAVADAAIPAFDQQAAEREALRLFPDSPLPSRGEFETKEAFQQRVTATESENESAARERQRIVDDRRREYTRQEQSARQARPRVDDIVGKPHRILYVAWPSTAPRYDIDHKQFADWPNPAPRLGHADYGLADMDIPVTIKTVPCSDVEVAKVVRTVSDNGNLWTLVELVNAQVGIEEGRETVERCAVEQLGDQTRQLAPEMAIRILAEYFSPGSTNNLPGGPMTQVNVERTKQVHRVTIRITADSGGRVLLYDASAKKMILTTPIDGETGMKSSQTERGFLGVRLDGNADEAKIQGFAEDSPAEKEGLKVGDVIIKLQDNTIKATEDLLGAMAATKPGDKVSVTVKRDGSEQTITVTLGTTPKQKD